MPLKEKTMKNKFLCALILLLTLLTFMSCGENSNENCMHTDAEDDGICDECHGSVIVLIDFYTVNDLHGKIFDTDSQPGLDELTTYLKGMSLSVFNDHTVILSSGDMWQGSSESNLTRGKMMTDWMNELGFVSMTLGNHEFDWGEEYIEDNLELAEFPFLAINVYDAETDSLADYCTPSVTVEKGGIQIGIIGAIGDCYSSISPDKVENVYFKTGEELTQLVKDEATRLRSEGVDLIVYSLHDGYGQSLTPSGTVASNKISSYYDPSLSMGYVDLVFEGHTHQKYVFSDTYDVYHLQNGGENKGICHVEIGVNSVTGSLHVNEAEFIASSDYDRFRDDPLIEELSKKYAEEIAAGNEILGNNASYRDGYDLCDKVAELYVDFGLEKWGENYDIVLGGGYLSARSPYSLNSGEVKYSDLQMLFPFDNKIVLCSVNGYDLKRKFIETNNSDYHIAYSEFGEEIKKNIDTDATYYIVVDTYTALYAPNKLTIVDESPGEIYARDLLAEYIKQGGLEK